MAEKSPSEQAELLNSIAWNGLRVPLQFPYLCVLIQGRPRHDMDEFALRHPSMERGKRAKIFSAFDALDGYGETIIDKNTVYTDKITLDDSEKEELNRRLSILRQLTRNSRMAKANRVLVTVEYYVPCTDEHSFACGIRGQYKTVTGVVRKVDIEEKLAIILNSAVIHFDDILSITASDPHIFEAYREE